MSMNDIISELNKFLLRYEVVPMTPKVRDEIMNDLYLYLVKINRLGEIDLPNYTITELDNRYVVVSMPDQLSPVKFVTNQGTVIEKMVFPINYGNCTQNDYEDFTVYTQAGFRKALKIWYKWRFDSTPKEEGESWKIFFKDHIKDYPVKYPSRIVLEWIPCECSIYSKLRIDIFEKSMLGWIKRLIKS